MEWTAGRHRRLIQAPLYMDFWLETYRYCSAVGVGNPVLEQVMLHLRISP
jgi:hypothetical protein